MKTTVKNTLNNENGIIMVVVLVILVMVSILAITASQTAVVEKQIATNQTQAVDELCDAEGGLINTMETSTVWLNNAFLTNVVAPNGEQTTSISMNNVDFDSDGNPDANVVIRCVQDTNPAVAAANNLPVASHITSPPEGSTPETTYSLGKFEVHRYAITATSVTGNTQVQAGVWMAFNK